MIRLIYTISIALFSNILLFGQVKYDQKQACNNTDFIKTIEKYIEHTVPTVTTDQLFEQKSEDLIILDAREMEEYYVSHIPEAQWVGFDDADYTVLENIDKDTEIVVYCSIGYRSEKVAEHIQSLGFSNVKNLYGSIFEWANDDYPLVNGKGDRVYEVHTYNKKWGKWMENNKINKIY